MIHHNAANPFPFKRKDGQTITDELCHCGHRRSEHHDTIAFGHGDCGECDCFKYTWETFLIEPKAVAQG